jgi:prephenate dehydrogenase
MTSPTDSLRPDRASGELRRAVVVGTGLIGGSIGLALRARGWEVSGVDRDPSRLKRALEMGVVSREGFDREAEVVFVATPAAVVAEAALDALSRCGPSAVVTDVAGVKRPVTEAVKDPRFIGGHPMAGSEQEGVEGADGELFVGATWVLTPTEETDPVAYTKLRALLVELGADVVALSPERHDALVAVVSHLPHLVAASLSRLAASQATDEAALLRLAAGGFRDMTRVAAGHPAIWPDVCVANAEEILSNLDRLSGLLEEIRKLIVAEDKAGIYRWLDEARAARRSLPSRIPLPSELAEFRVPIADRPGALAQLTTLAGSLDINIYDLEIAHSAEGEKGVAILVVDGARASELRSALAAVGLGSTYRPLEEERSGW